MPRTWSWMRRASPFTSCENATAEQRFTASTNNASSDRIRLLKHSGGTLKISCQAEPYQRICPELLILFSLPEILRTRNPSSRPRPHPRLSASVMATVRMSIESNLPHKPYSWFLRGNKCYTFGPAKHSGVSDVTARSRP